MARFDLTMDWMWGSCGKGGVSGYLALRNDYDAVVCSYGTQAGHSYNNERRGIKMMVQQLPVGIISDTVRTVFIGPGALIHVETMLRELDQYGHFLAGKRLVIHEHAAVVEDYHSTSEKDGGFTKIGSTAKGVGFAAIERIRRNPNNPNVAKERFRGTQLEQYVVDRFEYMELMAKCNYVLVEGAQGFSLSMYHGGYPYCTSRDVTPWQIGADCGLPFDAASKMKVIGVCRTFPIRVNNRDGSSGPAYPGQKEISWGDLGVPPELTTVTKLERRVFEFSKAQVEHAAFHCAGMSSEVVVTFADYLKDTDALAEIIAQIQSIDSGNGKLNVSMLCFGPDDADMVEVV